MATKILTPKERAAAEKVRKHKETAEELARTKADLKAARKRINQAAKAEQVLRERLRSNEDIAHAVREAARDCQVVGAPYIPIANSDKGRALVENAIGLSDLHIGAEVDPRQTSGRMAYNFDLARFGLLDILGNVCQHKQAMEGVYRIHRARVLVNGDVINGELRKDDAIGNEFPVPAQIVRCGRLISEGVGVLSAAFDEVIVDWVTGNHDRADEKPVSNKAVERSFAATIGEWVKMQTATLPNVDIRLHTDRLPTIDVNGMAIGLAHGDGIAMYKRMPYYGLRDLLVGRILEALDYKGVPPQMIVVGHFHEYSITDDGRVMVLPSLMGPTHWSREKGYRGAPAQVSFFVGKHGPFGAIPWRRQIPGVAP